MSKTKTWAVIHYVLMDMCMSQGQRAEQIMRTIHWGKWKGEEQEYWKKKVEEFLETSRPGDIFDLNGLMYIVRERPGG